jgi:hypothetical protein
MDLEDYISKARELDEMMKTVEKRHEEELRKYQDLRMMFRNAIQQYLVDNSMKSARTAAGQAVLAQKISYRVENPIEFRRHIIGTESWDMIVWAVKRSAAEQFEETEQTLPPGVAKSEMVELRLLAPERKRIRKPTISPESTQIAAFGDVENSATPK